MAKKAVQTPDVIDVGTVPEDQAIVTKESGTISAFVRRIGEFMAEAAGLERQADGLALEAAALKAPTSAAEDAKLQAFVQRGNGLKKAIVGHWEVTSAFFAFHKRLVALRERGAGKAGQAADVAQRLHNTYVEAERRRAAEETARLEREALDKARRDQEAEAARLEAEAVAREEQSAMLSPRERDYVLKFCNGLTAQQAAKAAGYKDPIATAARLNTSPKIIAAIQGAKEAATLRRRSEWVRERPVEVEEVAEVKPAIEKFGSDRTTWRAEVTDEKAFLDAVLSAKYGIPVDVLSINQAALTAHARDMHELINRWPGVKAVKNTRTV